MTTLEKIVKEAKEIKKNYPKKFAKWTDYIKEASKKLKGSFTKKKINWFLSCQICSIYCIT